MTENTGLRLQLVRDLMRLPYGWNYAIPGKQVRAAWPPTGDHDRSFEGALHAIALQSGGHRPETSYTTEERISNDLDGSFSWQIRPEDDKWVFHRKDSACPKCQGRLEIRTRRLEVVPPFDANVMPDLRETVDFEECDQHGAGMED